MVENCNLLSCSLPMQWGLRMPSAINDICSLLLLLLLRPPLLVGISLKTLTIKQRLKFRQGGSSPSSPSLRPPPLDPDYYTWKRRRRRWRWGDITKTWYGRDRSFLLGLFRHMQIFVLCIRSGHRLFRHLQSMQ
jgi:hypothetical protein